MCNFSYVFSCLFATDECDKFGSDCWLCPYYEEEEDEEEE